MKKAPSEEGASKGRESAGRCAQDLILASEQDFADHIAMTSGGLTEASQFYGTLFPETQDAGELVDDLGIAGVELGEQVVAELGDHLVAGAVLLEDEGISERTGTSDVDPFATLDTGAIEVLIDDAKLHGNLLEC